MSLPLSSAVAALAKAPSPLQVANAVGGFVDALASEHRLVEELIALMRAQREAVARDDLQGVDDGVFAIQRVLFTLGEARKRRRALMARLGQPEDISLRELEGWLGDAITPEFVRGRRLLQEAAQTLATEVQINRQVLREALAAGDTVVKAMYAAAEKGISYGAGPAAGTPTAHTAGGFLLNRRA